MSCISSTVYGYLLILLWFSQVTVTIHHCNDIKNCKISMHVAKVGGHSPPPLFLDMWHTFPSNYNIQRVRFITWSLLIVAANGSEYPWLNWVTVLSILKDNLPHHPHPHPCWCISNQIAILTKTKWAQEIFNSISDMWYTTMLSLYEATSVSQVCVIQQTLT